MSQIIDKISEEKLMAALDIKSKITLWSMRKRGSIKAYSFANSKKVYYDLEDVKNAFTERKNESE